MKYDFDTEISRRDTHAGKWTVIVDETGFHPSDEFFGENRILPLWVADMDFRCAQPIIDALTARAQHGIFGYSIPDDAYFASVVNWMQRRHGWQIDPSWIVTSPGVVPALYLIMRGFLNAGDGEQGSRVIIQPPVYHPFTTAVENNGGMIVENPLIFKDGRYCMDFDDLEAKARDEQVKLAILCHPHNPVGRVWTADELTRFAEICIENNVLIVSDGIHGDLIMREVSFKPLASLRPEFAPHVITCTSATKTFNIAGLHMCNIIIADEEKRQRYAKTQFDAGMVGAGAFGIVAVEAAYTHGDEWLNQVLEYIEGNLSYLRDYLAANLPQIRMIEPEGTYLVWLDCRALEIDREALHHLLFGEARVYLSGGHEFGEAGEGFQRINIACPRSILVEALDRIKAAVESQAASSEQ